MKFLNALAWVMLGWSLMALILPVLFMAVEDRALILAARQIHYSQHAPYRLGLLVVSVLWLIFGGR